MTDQPERAEPLSNRVAAVRLRALIAQQSHQTAIPRWLLQPPFIDPSNADDLLAEPPTPTTPHPPEIAA